MANDTWRGDAPAVAQVTTVTITADDAATTYKITINTKVVSVVGSGVSTTQTATNLKAQLIASTIPEFLEITWTSAAAVITGTAMVAGKPFTYTSSVVGGGGTIGAPSTTTASSGPNDYSTAGNWSLGAVPVATNDVFIETNVPIYYGLDQHTVTLNSFTVNPTFTSQLGLPILAKGPIGVPVNSTFTDVATGGTLLASTTYYYRVTALDGIGETTPSTETSKATAADGNNTHQITVTWGSITGAIGYKIYGRTTGAELLIGTVGNTTTFTDSGSVIPAGALPTINTTLSAVYDEYRGTHLQVQTATITVNSTSNLMRLDVGTVTAPTITVIKTGTAPTEPNTEPLRIKNGATATVINVQSGTVGLCRVAGDTGIATTLNVGTGATVTSGAGLTTTLASIGGTFNSYAALTTLTMNSAATVTHYTGAITTANVNFGTLVYRSSGTITTLVVGPTATLNCNQDLRSRTITNSTLYGIKGIDSQFYSVLDDFGTITWTNAPTRLSAANFPGPSNP